VVGDKHKLPGPSQLFAALRRLLAARSMPWRDSAKRAAGQTGSNCAELLQVVVIDMQLIPSILATGLKEEKG